LFSLILFLSLFFIALALVLTEKNAPYLLAGFNSLSKEEQAQVDLKSYLKFFRNFHIALGLSFGILGIALHFTLGDNAMALLLISYPILAYILFIALTNKFMIAKSAAQNRWATAVLSVLLIVILIFFFYDTKKSELFISENQIEITGSYGESIALNTIESIHWVDAIPAIRFKVHGFNANGISKGIFKTEKGIKVKLIVNSKDTHFLHIVKKGGPDIYYSLTADDKQKADLSIQEIKKRISKS